MYTFEYITYLLNLMMKLKNNCFFLTRIIQTIENIIQNSIFKSFKKCDII